MNVSTTAFGVLLLIVGMAWIVVWVGVMAPALSGGCNLLGSACQYDEFFSRVLLVVGVLVAGAGVMFLVWGALGAGKKPTPPPDGAEALR
jgi:hypothetical protein